MIPLMQAVSTAEYANQAVILLRLINSIIDTASYKNSERVNFGIKCEIKGLEINGLIKDLA